ncbi:hypothetical protein BGZ80_001336 [Entomortierella chlamydospora]|uniref:A-kinase anchor protein 7-like phosphoesterase domain-containing protein n=1 Tax=Entomortierella chlamydospora TaxID=101097 RepID=A0A9P6N2B3_9FUNG|nr:hypothetical protein BGZ80_001336 [Entomortierella chlamydospora]
MSSRQPLTHFLAIPLYTPAAANRINASLGRFATEARANTTVISSPSSTATSATATPTSIAARSADVTPFPQDTLASPIDMQSLNEQAIAMDINGRSNSNNNNNPSLSRGATPPPPPLLPKESLRPPSSLHLTLGVMSLSDPEQLDKAAAFLKSLDIQELLKSATMTADTSIARANAKAEVKAAAKARAKARARAKKLNHVPETSLSSSLPLSSSSSSPSPSAPSPPAASMSTDNDTNLDADGQQEQQHSAEEEVDEGAHSPIVVSLRGLLPMQAPNATSVLYAPPFDVSGRLQPFCEILLKLFVEAGFIQPERRPLKLHASIVNTLHVKNKIAHDGSIREVSRGRGGGGGGGGGRQGWIGRKKQRLLIDATELIKSWKDEVWAEVMLEKVVICEMGAKLSQDGLMRYREVAEVPLPTES